MNHAQEWKGVERRKARPSRDSIINLLNSYGTGFPEPEKAAEDLRKAYVELLGQPWTPRESGLPYHAVVYIATYTGSILFLAGGILLFLFLPVSSPAVLGIGLLHLMALAIWGAALTIGLLLILSRLSINVRTRTHTFRRFPLVRRAAARLTDVSARETVRDYIPVLRINGKPFFQIVYIKKGDALQRPTGILVLDDQGRAIWQYGILENVKLTASISILCGHLIQQRADQLRRSMRSVIERQIPDAVRILKQQEPQFTERGLGPRWTALMEVVSALPPALQDSITILDGEEEYRKAMGYSFALEFHYEDAQRLRELYLAYVKFLNASYRRKVISLTSEAAMLIQILEGKTDWREKESVLAALSTLAVAGTDGFLARICQKEYEGIVTDVERTAYARKTNQAKKMGGPVISE